MRLNFHLDLQRGYDSKERKQQKQERGPCGGGCTHAMHGRSRMTIDPRTPTMPGRNTSGFHRPGRHWGGMHRTVGVSKAPIFSEAPDLSLPPFRTVVPFLGTIYLELELACPQNGSAFLKGFGWTSHET